MPQCPHISKFSILNITHEINRGLGMNEGKSNAPTANSELTTLLRDEKGDNEQKRQMEGRGKEDTKVQKIQRTGSSNWHSLGFHGAWLEIMRVSHPGSSLISMSIAHAMTENILAFLPTVQYDLWLSSNYIASRYTAGFCILCPRFLIVCAWRESE